MSDKHIKALKEIRELVFISSMISPYVSKQIQEIISEALQDQQAKVFKPPAPLLYDYTRGNVFLGGTIDMGNSENWQERVTAELLPYKCNIYNPRRDDWDASWVQSIDNSQFREQVEWEQDALHMCDMLIFYFAAGSQSPITLMEFGQYIDNDDKKIVVFCPHGFWRKGNVDIVAKRAGVTVFEDYEEFIKEIVSTVSHWEKKQR